MAARVHHRAEAAAASEERRLRRSPPVDMRRERECRREHGKPRCGEVAGGTAAGCAAVCCCVPCAVVELVVLAAVRVPTALCRRVIRGRRRRRRAARAAAAKRRQREELLTGDECPSWFAAADADKPEAEAGELSLKPRGAEEHAEEEREVWASFYGTGFWRSPSQRDQDCR